MVKTPAPKPNKFSPKAMAERLDHSAVRIAAGFDTAADFANELGIKPRTYYRYERGEVLPSYDRLLEIAEKCRTDFKFLAVGRRD